MLVAGNVSHGNEDETLSIQAGIWNLDGEPADRQLLERISQATAQHGPDGETAYVNGSLCMLYRAFHTTNESCLEHQPYISAANNVITWDGRLDNREELVPLLEGGLAGDRTDVAIVAAAFDKWGAECFAKLLGDWALVIWNPRERNLILAKDFMGIRHLYYQQTPKRILWCTTPEPIVLLADCPWRISGEFIAGYLASYPPAHLTPYVGMDSVPPCSFITITQVEHKIQRYWQFHPGKQIRYRSDAEYEEHFREVFKEAIRRRLRSHMPIIAELSGGMDSSSVVCMADVLIAEGKAETPRLDTMSFYDNEEPNWNERPYFQKVEAKRGRTGCHISAVPQDRFTPLSEEHFLAIPGMDQSGLLFEKEQHRGMRARRNRVCLSGIGGDEVLGGASWPIPELADLLSQFRLAEFASKVSAWSLAQRRPWTHLLIEASWTVVRRPAYNNDPLSKLQTIPWLDRAFLEMYGKPFQEKPPFHADGCLHSQKAFLRALSYLARQLAYFPLPLVETCERRYPYLDRGLCEFLFAVPREQISRPAQRRSLMRRSLISVVPSEILQRKRKAFAVRRPMTMYEEAWPVLRQLFRDSLCQQFHYVNDDIFLHSLTETIHGRLLGLIQLSRTIAVELWLRRLITQKLICHPSVTGKETQARPIVYPVTALWKRLNERRGVRAS
jgi:asparagine synthase (glutamine-hydrolysing)